MAAVVTASSHDPRPRARHRERAATARSARPSAGRWPRAGTPSPSPIPPGGDGSALAAELGASAIEADLADPAAAGAAARRGRRAARRAARRARQQRRALGQRRLRRDGRRDARRPLRGERARTAAARLRAGPPPSGRHGGADRLPHQRPVARADGRRAPLRGHQGRAGDVRPQARARGDGARDHAQRRQPGRDRHRLVRRRSAPTCCRGCRPGGSARARTRRG